MTPADFADLLSGLAVSGARSREALTSIGDSGPDEALLVIIGENGACYLERARSAAGGIATSTLSTQRHGCRRYLHRCLQRSRVRPSAAQRKMQDESNQA